MVLEDDHFRGPAFWEAHGFYCLGLGRTRSGSKLRGSRLGCGRPVSRQRTFLANTRFVVWRLGILRCRLRAPSSPRALGAGPGAWALGPGPWALQFLPILASSWARTPCTCSAACHLLPNSNRNGAEGASGLPNRFSWWEIHVIWNRGRFSPSHQSPFGGQIHQIWN